MEYTHKNFKSEYNSWRQMRRRCEDVNRHNYHRYGGRGITVCDEWNHSKGFKAFMEHIGPKPSPIHTLGRIDSDINYIPGNIRWETPYEQTNNRYNTLKGTPGQKINMLTFIEDAPSMEFHNRKEKMGKFICDCGNTCEKLLKFFLYGQYRSCGCTKIKKDDA